MAKTNHPIFSKSILGNIEIFAVVGIFTLYALEFAGVHTFSQLFPEELQGETVTIGGLSLTGQTAEVDAVLVYTGLILIGVSIFLIVLRSKR